MNAATASSHLEHVSCDICGSSKARPLFDRARDGRARNVVCQRCGLVFVSPRRTPEAIKAHYTSGGFSAAARDARQPSKGKLYESETRALERFRTLRPHLDLLHDAPRRSLEIGSGIGSFSHLMQGLGLDAQALEPDPAFAAFGQDRYGVPISDRLYEETALPSGALGLVSSFHVIEHVLSPRRFLQKAHGELGMGGLLFLEMPTIDRPYRGDLEHFFWSVHLHTFSKNTIAGLLRSVGFEPVAFGYRDRAFLWVIAQKRDPSDVHNTPYPFDDPERVRARTLALHEAHRKRQRFGLLKGVARRVRAASGEAADVFREAPEKLLPAVAQKATHWGEVLQQEYPAVPAAVGAGVARLGQAAGRASIRLGKHLPAPKYVAHYGLHEPGNAGDTMLFAAVRQALERHRRVRWSLEPLWDDITPLVIERLNAQARAIVVGGGGLFLPDTNENGKSGWQWACPTELIEQIDVPLIVYAVGYNTFRGQQGFAPVFRDNVNALVRKSTFIGLRNKGSVQALSNHLEPGLAEKLSFQPCPTTVMRQLYPDLVRTEHPRGRRVLALNTAFDRYALRLGKDGPEALAAVARAIRRADEAGWQIKLAVHVAPRDATVLPWLVRAGVDFEEVNLHRAPPEAVIRFYRDVDLTVGMRGHSQMIPFGLGNAIISLISHDKLRWFLDDIGHPEWGVEMGRPDLEDALSDKIQQVGDTLSEVRGHVRGAQEELWQITKANETQFQHALP